MSDKKVNPLIRVLNVLKVLYHTNKSFFYLSIFNSLLFNFIPYISIYCGYLILDGLVNGAAKEYLFRVVLAMILLNLLCGLLYKFLDNIKMCLSGKTSQLVNKRISEKTFSLDYEQIEDNETMKMLELARSGSNGSGDITQCAGMLGNIIGNLSGIVYSLILLSSLFTSIESTSTDNLFLFLNNPYSALTIFLVIFISLMIGLFLSVISNKISYKVMVDNMDVNRKFGYFYDLCSNYIYGKDIRIYRMQKMIISNLMNSKWSVNKGWYKFVTTNIFITNTLAIMNFILMFYCYSFIGLRAWYGINSIGSVISLVGSVTLFAQSITSIVSSIVALNLTANYLNEYFKYLNIKPLIGYGKAEIDKKKPLYIEFKDVSFAYPHQDQEILSHINLKIKPGEKLAIVGENGAGKTTLIKLLCHFYNPTSGTILINNIPLNEYSRNACYDLFSIVFQDFKLFSFSIKENVASSDIDIDEEKVNSSLEKAGILDRVNNLKDKSETIIYNKNEETGVEISGGEAQKIAIARALYKDSPIVILDEPTSALDPKSEAEIYEKFANLVKDKTSIFISHRMSSCRFCDEIIVFENGKIIQEGTHQELLKDIKGKYYMMWSAQAKYYQD
jgi:ABC-type multidrug transport system, ATPase and permease components